MVDHRADLDADGDQLHRQTNALRSRAHHSRDVRNVEHVLLPCSDSVPPRIHHLAGAVRQIVGQDRDAAWLHAVRRNLDGGVDASRDRPKRAAAGVVPVHPRSGRGGQLARCGEGGCRMVPGARARVRDGDLQQRRQRRRCPRAAIDRIRRADLRLAKGLLHRRLSLGDRNGRLVFLLPHAGSASPPFRE